MLGVPSGGIEVSAAVSAADSLQVPSASRWFCTWPLVIWALNVWAACCCPQMAGSPGRAP